MAIRVLLFFFAFTYCHASYAQDSFFYRSFEKKWKFTYGIGTTYYLGDLSFDGGSPEFKGAVNFEIEKKINPWIQVRATATHYNLHSAKTFQGDGTYSFRSRNWTFHGTAILNLLPNSYQIGNRLNRFYSGDNPVIPYVFAGVGFGTNNARSTLNDQEFIPEAREKMFLVLPMGTGIRWRIDPFMEIAFEGSLNMTSSDMLDNVSINQNPVQVDDVANVVPIAKKDFDHYLLFQAKFSYYLPFNFAKHKKAINRNMKYWK